jgi:hypothetical protein
MPHTTYALFKAIRSHQIASPNLAGSLGGGAPNACNLCHLDQTLAWTQKHLGEWYGAKPVLLTDEQENVSASLLWLLKGHAAQRVITAWHFGWEPAQVASGEGWLAPFVARLLADPYGAVRYVAGRSLRTLAGFNDFEYDFLAPERVLSERSIEASRLWRASRADEPANGSGRILLDERGDVMDRMVTELVDRRDNRSVTIKE